MPSTSTGSISHKNNPSSSSNRSYKPSRAFSENVNIKHSPLPSKKSKKNISRHTQTPKSWKIGSEPKHFNNSAKHQKITSNKKKNKNKKKADINALNLTSSKNSSKKSATHSTATQSTATQSTEDVRPDPNNKTFGRPENESSLIGPAVTESTVSS